MKNFNLITIALTIFISTAVYSQSHTWQWGKYGSGYDYTQSLAVLPNGNYYISGACEYSTAFGTDTLHDIGSHNFFVARYNAQGSLNWVRGAKSATVYSQVYDNIFPQGVAADADGNVLVTGSFVDYSQIVIGNDTLRGDSGIVNYFLAKYDVSGNPLWAKTASGSHKNLAALKVHADLHNNVYVTGYSYKDTLVFGSTMSVASPGFYLVKYDAAGNVKWVRRAHSVYNAGSAGTSLSIDPSGNIFVNGYFSTEVVFGTDTLINTIGAASTAGFIAKYDSLGNVLWAKSPYGITGSIPNPLIADDRGNCYVSGYGTGVIRYGTDSLVSAPGIAIPYVVKLDPAGNPVWIKKLSNSVNAYPSSIALDGVDNPYVAGAYWGDSVYFAHDTLLGRKDDDNSFIEKFDSTGQMIWAQGPSAFGGLSITTQNSAYGIGIDAAGNVYSSGIFGDSSIAFGTDTLIFQPYLPPYGHIYYYMAKVEQCVKRTAAISQSGAALSTGTFASYQWLHGGQPVGGATQQTYTPTANGSYQVVVNAAGNCPDTSAVFSFVTGIAVLSSGSMRIYPNPAAGLFILETQDALGTELTLSDILGHVVLTQTITGDKQIVNTGSISDGMYFVSVKIDGVINTSRVIIAKD